MGTAKIGPDLKLPLYICMETSRSRLIMVRVALVILVFPFK